MFVKVQTISKPTQTGVVQRKSTETQTDVVQMRPMATQTGRFQRRSSLATDKDESISRSVQANEF